MSLRVWMMLLALISQIGCMHPDQQTRLQSAEDKERDGIRTIGDVTSVANADPIPISGVGLVVGLEGTGGGMPPPSGYRSLLEHQLRKMGIDNIKEVLSDPNHALVLVSALVPPGARKNDQIDIEVSLPPNSKTTSLRGGVLKECVLFNYESTQALNPNYTGGNRLLGGHPLAKAAGPVLVGFGDGDAEARLRQGRIWAGGRCSIDRPFFLALTPGQQYARTAMRIADRANQRFQGPYGGAGNTNLAEAKTREVVYLGVPATYQHNLPRYLRVVRLIPLDETPVGSPYRRRLAEELLDPATTVSAALRLEALGSDTLPALRTGMKSDHPLVRFASAEALTYLGEPIAAEELAMLAAEQPFLRAYCLTALASLEDQISHVKLRELLGNATPETRYGAFRALSVRTDHDQVLSGERLNGAFVMYRVAAGSAPLVHLTTSGRAEIVLFGDSAFLQPPFSFLAGPEFTITAGHDDQSCMVSRFSLQHGTSRRQCGMTIEEVIRTMASLGGSYADVIDLLRQADKTHCLTCKVAVDALPSAASVFELARAGSEDADATRGLDAEIIQAKGAFSATPNLFGGGKSITPPARADKSKQASTTKNER